MSTWDRQKIQPGATVIKLFDSENVLKFKNLQDDFLEILCLSCNF